MFPVKTSQVAKINIFLEGSVTHAVTGSKSKVTVNICILLHIGRHIQQ